jgi:hypothetical protein
VKPLLPPRNSIFQRPAGVLAVRVAVANLPFIITAFVVGVIIGLLIPCASGAQTNSASDLVWHDARELCVEGKGWADTKHFYDRLPARAEGVVPPAVWDLSQDSAGMSVRFESEATEISARWKLRKDQLAMPHMPATGVSGVDLYVKEKSQWRWLANGRPLKQFEEKVLVKGLTPKKREFMLYLPLYNGVDEVQLGVPGGSTVAPLAVRTRGRKPIVFYGTSILQGGCASRPGMAYPAILGRRLDWPAINLGFSGSAHSEPEIAALLAELDPAVYVLDPLPNMTAEMVAQRIEPFVLTLRKAHPSTPIVLVENARYPDEQFLAAKREKLLEANARLREVFDRLTRAGQKRIYYFRAEQLLGDDGEATVDGSHPTDLGFLRMADRFEPLLRRVLSGSR